MVRGHDTFSFADSYEISDWLKMLLSQKYFFWGKILYLVLKEIQVALS